MLNEVLLNHQASKETEIELLKNFKKTLNLWIDFPSLRSVLVLPGEEFLL
jgi:hypothetical protein